MANYAVRLQRTASASASVGNVVTGGRRMKILDFSLGFEGTPADVACRADFQRCTTAGTSTAVTPQPRDAADAASSFTAGQNHTIEPTYTANAIQHSVSFNQRSWVRWVAAPGDEIVVPTTANNGIGIQTPVTPTVAITASLSVCEL